ncbi:uncharacterized protein [Watersipora subatra]|uniref:uncharacterized protein n=1 Tax=Watersipora subatra TaxID=2589382 RepID=UPI00355BD054
MDSPDPLYESMTIFSDLKDSWRSSSVAQHTEPVRLDDILGNGSKHTSMDIASARDKKLTYINDRSRSLLSSPGAMLNRCKDFVLSSLQRHKGSSTGCRVFDSLLRQCQLCKVAVSSLTDAHELCAQTNQGSIDEGTLGASCLHLVSSSEVIYNLCQLCVSMSDDIDSKHISETVNQMSQLSVRVCHLIVQLMEALSSSLSEVIAESSASLIGAIHELCTLCGIMSLATDASLVVQSNDFVQLACDLQMACTRGALQQCVHTAEERLGSISDSIQYMTRGVKTTHATPMIYDGVRKVLEAVQSFLTSYKKEASSNLSLQSSGSDSDLDPCQKYDSCTQAISSMGTIGDSLSTLTKPLFTQGKEYDRAIVLKAANAIKKCCRNISADCGVDCSHVVGAVGRLFAVTEAEGKVKVHHKSAEPLAARQVKRMLPQVESVEKMKRVLPPSPDNSSSSPSTFTESSSKSVQKLAAMFEGGSR